jgi:hypothetical protein
MFSFVMEILCIAEDAQLKLRCRYLDLPTIEAPMKLEKRYQAVRAERLRLRSDFERRLAVLRAQLEAARNNHLGNDIRDVANEGVTALTKLAEFIARQHLALMKKKGLIDGARDHWLNFVNTEMQAMYDLCAAAVVGTNSLLPGRRDRVITASLDFLNEQSRTYISSLEQKLAVESEPTDARSLSERLVAVVCRNTNKPSVVPQLDAGR